MAKLSMRKLVRAEVVVFATDKSVCSVALDVCVDERTLWCRLVRRRDGGVLAGDDVLATVLLDQADHHSCVVNIDGRSSRLREMEDQAAEG